MISGSRNPNGQTARAADAVLKGLENAGVSVIRVFLPTLTIERCRQCDERGWGVCRSEGRCIIEDEFAEIVAQLKQADVVVFANPVYFSDLSESLRAFTDRLRRTTRHENGQADIKGTPAIGVCVAGGGGGGAPACCVSLERTLSTCGFDVVDMIPVRRQNLETKLPALELVGTWLATAPRSS
jgi:multimeric flavodoxin WrbA